MTINEEQTLSPPHAQISDQVGTDGIHILSMTKITASNPDFKNVLKNDMCVSFATRHAWNDGKLQAIIFEDNIYTVDDLG